MNLDLTKVFTDIGMLFARELGLNVKQGIGVDGESYSRPALSTLKARSRTITKTNLRGRARKSTKGMSTSLMRLFVTGDLANRGFSSMAGPDQVRIFATDVPHTAFYGSNPLLSDIVRWNSRGQAGVNPHIDNPPLVFPTTVAEIEMMDSTKQAWQIFTRGVNDLIKEQAKLDVKANLKLG